METFRITSAELSSHLYMCGHVCQAISKKGYDVLEGVKATGGPSFAWKVSHLKFHLLSFVFVNGLWCHLVIWQIYQGAHKKTGQKVSVFVFDKETTFKRSKLKKAEKELVNETCACSWAMIFVLFIHQHRPPTQNPHVLLVSVANMRVMLYTSLLKFVEIMRKEVKELAVLRHPHILRVIDVRIGNKICKPL